jgi:uncharacterized sulfatase
MNRPVLILLVILSSGLFFAHGYADDYKLKPRKIAQDTYVLQGVDEDFSFQNGGNILNTGFIVTSQGVLVIDTGPSLLYGEQLREVISSITSKKILQVYNTHLHPDHFLGNQAFAEAPIAALPGTITGMRQQADMFTDNMYRLAGHWMVGTNPLIPTEPINLGTVDIGGHRLSFIELRGHTQADLVIFDHSTGVLFAGDLVFHNRAPTTPHADIDKWLESLEKLEDLAIKIIVPGHGAVEDGTGPILQTRSYLRWLDSTLRKQAELGKDMVEVLNIKIPPEFATLAVLPNEYHRSVSQLYGKLERQALQPMHQPDR